MDNKDTFHFIYSAKEQEEIKNIRKKYTGPEPEDKMAKLRRLDASVTQKATTAALIFGIVGVLVLGLGMSLVMSELSEIIGVQKELSILIGVIIGILGIILICLAYPIYQYILNREKKKIAPEILRLTDELMK